MYSIAKGESSVGKYVKLISPVPRQYLFSSSIVLFKVFLVGLLASNKSPPNKRKSTYRLFLFPMLYFHFICCL